MKHVTQSKSIRRAIVGAALIALVMFGVDARGQNVPNTDYDLTLTDVELWPGETIDVHVKVFVNENRPCNGRTVLAVHGLTHTGASWGPLAEELFAQHPAGGPVCRVAAIDLPGRGGSGVPTGGRLFGDILLDDFTTVLLNTMNRLPEVGIRPMTIMGHSQGGLLIQMAQQRLIDSGTNLRTEYGIRTAVLVSSSPSAGMPWFFSNIALSFFEPYVTWNPVLGLHIDIPDQVWPYFYFMTPAGMPVSNFPTPEQVAEYNSVEPTASSSQLIGQNGFVRPFVQPGIFGPWNGTTVFMTANEQDLIIHPAENVVAYGYLTGDAGGLNYAVITGAEAVHDLFISDPAALLAGMFEKFGRGIF